MPTPRYSVNEVFLTVQGEGIRCGTVNVFVRFTACNLRCAMDAGDKSPGGFDCDTEFVSGRTVTLDELVEWIKQEAGSCRWLVLTGGEPALQVDAAFIARLHAEGYQLAIETNGSVALPDGLDWITVSPKVAEHCIRQLTAHEVKYVRSYGQSVPHTVVTADHYLISPGFDGAHANHRNISWCLELVKTHPTWRLSLQQHKGLVTIR